MDKLLQAALERRDELRAELSAVDDLILRLQRLETKDEGGVAGSAQSTFSFHTNSRSRLTPQELEALLERSSELILEAGRPLTRSELLRQLEAEGFVIFGGDRAKVLGTNLWRSGRFESAKGGYWPVSTPVPEQYRDQG